jgi:hypothetical protein
MGCCGLRNTEFSFELVYRVYPANPQQRLFQFTLELPENLKEENFIQFLEQNLIKMSVPPEVKAQIKSKSYLFNDVPVNQATISFKALKRRLNTIFIEKVF